jgi:hypothetical protein
MLTNSRSVGDQLAVPDVLVEFWLAQAQPTPGLADAPAAVPFCGQCSIQSLHVHGRQPNPARIERRFLLGRKKTAPAPAADR